MLRLWPRLRLLRQKRWRLRSRLLLLALPTIGLVKPLFLNRQGRLSRLTRAPLFRATIFRANSVNFGGFSPFS